MSMDTSARMIGNYTGPHLELYTEKVTGTTTACLGLIQSKDCYIPNSVLSEDIRSIVPKPPGKIFAIFKKPIWCTTIYTAYIQIKKYKYYKEMPSKRAAH